MIIVNFSHPITGPQKNRIEELARLPIERIIDVPSQFDEATAFVSQVGALVDSAGLSPADWESAPLIVGLPSLNTIAALLIAEIHGRSGYFPAILRMRPVRDSVVRQYEVAEILDLQSVRDKARTVRNKQS